MRPGARQFTVMPSGATWSDSVLAHAVVALRTAFDNIRLGIGCFTDDDVLTITRPQRWCRMFGKHNRVSLIADIRFRSTAAYQSSSLSVSKTPGLGPPALLNTMPIASKVSTVVLTTRSRSFKRVTSAVRPATRAPSAATARTSFAAASMAPGLRENITTFAPSAASARATPLPRPLLAAATMAVLPRSPRSMAASVSARSALPARTGSESVLPRRLGARRDGIPTTAVTTSQPAGLRPEERVRAPAGVMQADSGSPASALRRLGPTQRASAYAGLLAAATLAVLPPAPQGRPG